MIDSYINILPQINIQSINKTLDNTNAILTQKKEKN